MTFPGCRLCLFPPHGSNFPFLYSTTVEHLLQFMMVLSFVSVVKKTGTVASIEILK
jgi:hypothetical protein